MHPAPKDTPTRKDRHIVELFEWYVGAGFIVIGLLSWWAIVRLGEGEPWWRALGPIPIWAALTYGVFATRRRVRRWDAKNVEKPPPTQSRV